MWTKDKQKSYGDQIIYCYDIANNCRGEWAGSDFITNITTIKVGTSFYDISHNLVLFESPFDIMNCEKATLSDISYGMNLFCYIDKKMYSMLVRKRRWNFNNSFGANETPQEYQTYLNYMKKAFQEGRLYKVSPKKSDKETENQLKIYD